MKGINSVHIFLQAKTGKVRKKVKYIPRQPFGCWSQPYPHLKKRSENTPLFRQTDSTVRAARTRGWHGRCAIRAATLYRYCQHCSCSGTARGTRRVEKRKLRFARFTHHITVSLRQVPNSALEEHVHLRLCLLARPQ